MDRTLAQTPDTAQLTGNRCGFVLDLPRHLDTRHPHPLIAAMQDAARKLFEARRDGMLWLGRKRWRHRERGERHERLPRGERAESIALVVEYMTAHLNLGNLRIIDYSSNEGVSVARIAHGCGLSVDRAKGAIADLKSCGYLGGFQARELRAGQYRGKVATRWFSRGMLEMLGRLVGRNFVRWLAQLRGSEPRAASRPAATARPSAHAAELVRSFVGDLVRQQV